MAAKKRIQLRLQLDSFLTFYRKFLHFSNIASVASKYKLQNKELLEYIYGNS